MHHHHQTLDLNLFTAFHLLDTEPVHSFVPRVEEATNAILLEWDECQCAPRGSFEEQHAVPLLRQLLVQQGAEQLGGDGVHHVPQQSVACVQGLGRIGKVASARSQNVMK